MLDVADHYADDMEKQMECRAKIKEASYLLLELVNDVLDMSKLESGEVVLEEIPFNLSKIAEDVLTVIEQMAAERNIQDRVNQIKNEIANTTSSYDKDKLKERLAKLAGGVAVLYVGANSEVEMKEKKDRVDDALCATRAATEEGVVVGGGTTYIRAQKELEDLKGANADEQTGINIVRRAIEEPLRQD